MLTVQNGNNFDFTGRYNGVDYLFPSGKITAIPDDAARHIFGVGEVSKHDILVRHGWMQTSNDLGKGHSILNNFSFNVADTLEAGQIIDVPVEEHVVETPVVKVATDVVELAQGSAPLQTGSGGDASVSDGSVEQPPQPTKSILGGSILDTLNGVTGE